MYKSQLLDGIVVFVEVIKQGSFTNAAASTGHSTSFISKEVNKLEDRLGVRLLQRTTRTLKLTPEGEVFYENCTQIIEDAKQAMEQVTGHLREPQGSLKVSSPIGFGLSRLKPLLGKFAELYPKVQLQLDLSDRKVDLVEEGVDIAIRASSHLDDSSLISRKLMKSNGVVLASPEYLAKHGVPRDPEELINHRAITYSLSKQPNLWEFEGKEGENIAINVDSIMQTNSPEMEMQMCKSGLGIVRLPDFHLEQELVQGSLVELFPDYPKYQLDIHLVYPSRKHLAAKVRVFIDFLFDELGD